MGSCFSKEKRISKLSSRLKDSIHGQETNLKMLQSEIASIEERMKGRKGKPPAAELMVLRKRKAEYEIVEDSIISCKLLIDSEQRFIHIIPAVEATQKIELQLRKELGDPNADKYMDKIRSRQEEMREKMLEEVQNLDETRAEMKDVDERTHSELENLSSSPQEIEIQPDDSTLQLLKREAPSVPLKPLNVHLSNLFTYES